MNGAQPAPRYHAFDALRGSMMLLGVALHSATAYSTFPDVWWLKDPQTSRWADLFILWIHTFRLPLFFAMSGFFAAMLVERRGVRGFLRNRAARLLLPFLLGMAAMFPFLKLSSVYAWFLARDPEPWRRVQGWLAEGRFWRSLEPMHLWFLIVLMILCAGAALLEPVLRRALACRWFARLLEHRAGWLVWAVLTFLSLLPMQLGILDTPGGFVPEAGCWAPMLCSSCSGGDCICTAGSLRACGGSESARWRQARYAQSRRPGRWNARWRRCRRGRFLRTMGRPC